jgi:hypothetical protein
MLIDGDGSLYQHIQELETVRRHGIKLLICIINDGGYGAETHKFRAYGVDPVHATHGRGDLAQVARGFAATVDSETTQIMPSNSIVGTRGRCRCWGARCRERKQPDRRIADLCTGKQNVPEIRGRSDFRNSAD